MERLALRKEGSALTKEDLALKKKDYFDAFRLLLQKEANIKVANNVSNLTLYTVVWFRLFSSFYYNKSNVVRFYQCLIFYN